MNKIRLAVIDEHRAVRAALETRLRSSDAIEVVRTTQIAKLEQLCPEREGPDVVLFGLKSSNSQGLEPALETVSDMAAKGIRVIVLASFADDIQRELLLKAGAESYLLKDINSDQLIAAILAEA